MAVCYRLRQDLIRRDDGSSTVAFGLDAVDDAGRIFRSVPDLFSDRQRAMDLIKLCNALELSIIHLDDVIGDIL